MARERDKELSLWINRETLIINQLLFLIRELSLWINIETLIIKQRERDKELSFLIIIQLLFLISNTDIILLKQIDRPIHKTFFICSIQANEEYPDSKINTSKINTSKINTQKKGKEFRFTCLRFWMER